MTVLISFWMGGDEILFHLPEEVFDEVLQETEEIQVYVRPGTVASAIAWLEKGHGIFNYLMYRQGNGGAVLKFQGSARDLRLKIER